MMMKFLLATAVLVLSTPSLVYGDLNMAFVLLGPTGDNALRPNGVWQGLYESWAGGVFDSTTVQVHPTMNTPHTDESLMASVMESLSPLYADLQNHQGWECKAPNGDCDPTTFYTTLATGNVNIQDKDVYGRDPFQQTETMIAAMEPYPKISMYLSIPPYAFGDWATAASKNFGVDRLWVAAEKPFGNDLESAQELYTDITATAGLPESHLLLIDHWLSFFMVPRLPLFASSVLFECLEGMEASTWGSASVGKIVITEHEVRGLEGRGGFFDGVGQVRDLDQSHLLQVLGNMVIDPSTDPGDIDAAKLAVFEELTVRTCNHGQYAGWLYEQDLGYHPTFADATLSTMYLTMGSETKWNETQFVITTGKLMDTTLYTVDLYQQGGPGIITLDIGAEEVGVAGIKVSNWPLQGSTDQCTVTVPAPGFDTTGTLTMTSESENETTMLVSYDTEALYFPTPYSVMVSHMIDEDYTSGFVTWLECQESWRVITAGNVGICMDPPAGAVMVYQPPSCCGNTPPEVCYTDKSVQDLYDVQFACTPDNDVTWQCLNFYQDKCGLAWDPPECADYVPPNAQDACTTTSPPAPYVTESPTPMPVTPPTPDPTPSPTTKSMKSKSGSSKKHGKGKRNRNKNRNNNRGSGSAD